MKDPAGKDAAPCAREGIHRIQPHKERGKTIERGQETITPNVEARFAAAEAGLIQILDNDARSPGERICSAVRFIKEEKDEELQRELSRLLHAHLMLFQIPNDVAAKPARSGRSKTRRR